MDSNQNNDLSINDSRLTGYPALAALRITADELAALSHQGFVGEERRGARKYYKLRFRHNGKQWVRYVGSAERAAVVRQELCMLQHHATVRRELKASVKVANKMLREYKAFLKPILAANGLAFHGRSIRRPRKRVHDDTVSISKP